MFVLNVLVLFTKMACVMFARTIPDQAKPVISKQVRLFCNKKFRQSRYKNYLKRVRLTS